MVRMHALGVASIGTNDNTVFNPTNDYRL